VPLALGRFPSERHAGATVFVVRLDHERLAVRAQERQELDAPSVARDAPLLDDRGPRDVLSNEAALLVAAELRVALVGQHGEERLLLRNLAAPRVGDADGALLVRAHQPAALLFARAD